jgi:amino acid transporter
MPMTAAILFVMLLVVLLYREVVVVYTRAGGSYVVARDNFGPRIAQVAAVALLIDYVVTVAVQIAAGTAAVASAFPVIGPYVTPISIGVILLMCLGNLRGIREASAGHFMFWVVQAATALILYTGGNTSFNGFPFLTSFVAEDSFLPRWLMKRGHRLVFSNGIIVLTVLSVTLIGVIGANVNALVPFYAIGVFTAFSMAGFGMAKYFHTHKGPGWRHKLVICFSSGVLTSIVVVIFAVVKFTSGAWLILIIFPVGVLALIRLNREYRHEANALQTIGDRRASGVGPSQPNYSRRVVVIFVDDLDLSTIVAIRYAKGLRPTTLRAVHFVIDTEQAEKLRQAPGARPARRRPAGR